MAAVDTLPADVAGVEPSQLNAGELAALRSELADLAARLDAIGDDVSAVLAIAHELGKAVQQFAGMAEQLSGGGIGAVLGMLRK